MTHIDNPPRSVDEALLDTITFSKKPYVPPPEQPKPPEQTQQLQRLQEELAALKKAQENMAQDQRRLFIQFHNLLNRTNTPSKAEERAKQQARERKQWLSGFGTALMLSPFIVHFGNLAVRLAMQGHLSAVQICALLCIGAGLLVLRRSH